MKPGPSPKLTPALQQRIVDMIARGNCRDVASASCGIYTSTLRKWLSKGALARSECREDVYSRFLDAMDKAEADLQASMLRNIAEASFNDWRAAAWRLEKLRPQRYGAQIRVRVEAEVERLLDVAERILAPTDFSRLLEAITAASGGGAAGEDQPTETDGDG